MTTMLVMPNFCMSFFAALCRQILEKTYRCFYSKFWKLLTKDKIFSADFEKL